jgi:hypothetical protein
VVPLCACSVPAAAATPAHAQGGLLKTLRAIAKDQAVELNRRLVEATATQTEQALDKSVAVAKCTASAASCQAPRDSTRRDGPAAPAAPASAPPAAGSPPASPAAPPDSSVAHPAPPAR